MRWLGALLLVCAGAAAGMLKTAGIKGRIHRLDELIAFVERVGRELEMRGAPLPQLLQKTAGDLPLEPLIRAAQQGTPLQTAAEDWLGSLGEERTVLKAWLGILGRYDSPTQVAACRQALENLRAQKAALQADLTAKAPIYRAVPLTISLMAAVALL